MYLRFFTNRALLFDMVSLLVYNTSLMPDNVSCVAF